MLQTGVRVSDAPPAKPAVLRPREYPEGTVARDRWVLAHRGPRPVHDRTRPHSAFVEPERTEAGAVTPVLTVLLVSRECPWRCVMCDLWKFTVPGPMPAGFIPRQLAVALGSIAASTPLRRLKLYNAGSFFDAQAIPPGDHPALARQLAGFERVTVECHPSLVGRRILLFRDQVEKAAEEAGCAPAALEIALGLETAHPEVLPRLNKRLTLDGFRRAAEFLGRHRLGLRAFILVQPPFLDESEAIEWAGRSLELAFDSGATAAVLIPTRFGNGALEALARRGQFTPPRLDTLECALDQGVRLGRGRVFADLWNLGEFSACPACLPARRARLERINLTQSPAPPVTCSHCSHGLGNSGAGSCATPPSVP